MTKIADFFIQISTKGDIKVLKDIVNLQKQSADLSKNDLENRKLDLRDRALKLREQKRENSEENKNAKIKDIFQKKSIDYLNRTYKQSEKNLIQKGKEWNIRNKNFNLMKKGMLTNIGLTPEIVGMANAFIGVAVAITTASVALHQMIMNLAKANQQFTNFQRQTGLNLNNVMGGMGAAANLDYSLKPEDIMSSMQNLQNQMTGIEFGQGNIAPFQIAGINPIGLNADQMMDVIRKRMQGFAPKYRTFLLQQMGVDPRLGALSDLTDEEYLNFKKESLELYLSPEDRKELQDMTVEWNKAGLKWTRVWDKTLLILGRNTQELAQLLGVLANTTESLLLVLEKFWKLFQPLLDVLTILARMIFYVLEDWAVAASGGKSVTGELLKYITFKDSKFKHRDNNNDNEENEAPIDQPLLSSELNKTINNSNNKVATLYNNHVPVIVNVTDDKTGVRISDASQYGITQALAGIM